jgi:hypothetical protein
MGGRTAQKATCVTEQGSGRRVRAVLAVVAVVSASLGLAAPSFADPGRPGLAEATQAVYPEPISEPGQEVFPSPPPGPEGPAPGQGVEDIQVESPKGGGEAGAPNGIPGEQVAGDVTGLPFTGLSAPLILLAGLMALALGLTLRISMRHSRELTGASGGP